MRSFLDGSEPSQPITKLNEKRVGKREFRCRIFPEKTPTTDRGAGFTNVERLVGHSANHSLHQTEPIEIKRKLGCSLYLTITF